MKLKVLTAFVLGILLYSCQEEEKHLIVSGQLTNNTECKNFLKSASQPIITPDSLSCVEYSYNNQYNKLIFKHINAGFNCCPEKINCDISLINDTINIREFEKSALCDCDCLYDLDIEVTGVDRKKYQIKFIELYCCEQEKLIFEIDLTTETEGSYCVVRKQYPWGIYSMSN